MAPHEQRQLQNCM